MVSEVNNLHTCLSPCSSKGLDPLSAKKFRVEGVNFDPAWASKRCLLNLGPASEMSRFTGV